MALTVLNFGKTYVSLRFSHCGIAFEPIQSASANGPIIVIIRFFQRAQRSSKFRRVGHLPDFGTPFAFYKHCGSSDLSTEVNSQQE